MWSLADKCVFAFDAGVEILYLLAFTLTHPGCCSCTSTNINTLSPDTLLWYVSITCVEGVSGVNGLYWYTHPHSSGTITSQPCILQGFFRFLHVQLPNMLLFVAFWQKDYCVHIIWESSRIMKNSDLDFPNFYFCALVKKMKHSSSLVSCIAPCATGLCFVFQSEWTHCCGHSIVFPSALIEIQLFGFYNMTCLLLTAEEWCKWRVKHVWKIFINLHMKRVLFYFFYWNNKH